MDLKQTDYGSGWVDQALEKQVATPETFTDAYVDKIVSTISQKLIEATNQKIDAQLVNLADLQKQYPNNPDVKKAIEKAIDELTTAKDMVTPETIFDANKMESVIETLNKYGSKDAYDKLKDKLKQGAQQNPNGNNQALDEAKKNTKAAIENLNNLTTDQKTAAKEVINGLTNLNQAQKEAALAQVEAATTVDEAKNYATTAITLDDTMGALQKAVTDGNNGKFTDPKYYNADATTRAAYDKALSNAQAVLDDANATQAQIDQAKADLAQAAEALTGKATDKSALQATYNQANVAAKTTAYTNANDTIKRAYEKALSEAQAVLVDANATQAQVDLAKAALDEIMALLKGASGDATVAKNSSGQSDQNSLSKAATAIDGKNTTPITSSASKQNQLPQTGAADDASLVAADLGLTLASMLLGLGAKLKRRQN